MSDVGKEKADFSAIALQEILDEVFRELHKVKDEIIDGMFSFPFITVNRNVFICPWNMPLQVMCSCNH